MDSKHNSKTEKSTAKKTKSDSPSEVRVIATPANRIDRVENNSFRSTRIAIFFGVVVFLVGQALTMSGFLAGHFGAWVVGSIFSVAGIVVAMFATMDALRRVESLFSAVQTKRPHTLGQHPNSSERENARLSRKQSA